VSLNHIATGDTREGGEGLRPASQETYRRSGRSPGGVPRARFVTWSALSRPFRTPYRLALRSGFPGVTLTEIDADQDTETRTGATVYVCVTCRKPGDPDDGPRPGLALARATAEAAEGTDVTVRRVECLANCSRSLSAAMRCDGTWTYIFGGLDADRDAEALIEGAQLLARAEDGILPWRGRPDILKKGLIARVPPNNFPEETE
jgi:predicted metal-binding protein